MMSMLGPAGAVAPSAHKIGRAAAALVQELGVVAVVAAMAPFGRAERSFERTVDRLLPVAVYATPTGRPVLLVHGFAGTKSCWFALTRALRAQGVIVDAINYAPLGISVEGLADRLAVKVAGLLSETGADKVHLVGHSLGGVVIAQAFADGRLTGQVDTVVTIAAPFGGLPSAARGDPTGAPGRFAAPPPARRLTTTRRRALDGLYRDSRRHRAQWPVSATSGRSADRNGQRRWARRTAPEPTGCGSHRRHVAARRAGRGMRGDVRAGCDRTVLGLEGTMDGIRL